MTPFWEKIIKAVILVSVLLVILLAAEIFRLALLLGRIHPMVGAAFLGVVGLGILWLILYGLLAWARVRTSHPPELPPNLLDADFRGLRRFCRYLAAQADCLSINPNLNDEVQDRAMEAARDIKEALCAHPLLDDLRRIIEKMQTETLPELTAALNRMGVEKIRETVETVSWDYAVGTFTGNCARFLFTKCVALDSALAAIYWNQHGLLSCAAIFRDTSRMIRSPRFSGLFHEWISRANAGLPENIRSCGNWAQGLHAGLLVRLFGAVVMRRATGLPPWNKYSESEFLEAEWPTLSGNVEAWVGRQAEQPSATPAPQAASISGPHNAKGQTSLALSMPTPQPAAPYVSPIYATPHPDSNEPGHSVADTPQPPHLHPNGHSHRSRRSRKYRQKGMFRVLRTFIQRMRYTLLGFRS